MDHRTQGRTRRPNLRTLAAIGALALGASLAGPATAQVRAALVKNVDEPGRAPYQAQVEFNANSGCGGASACNFVTFPAVPAGKRLVVQQLTILVGVVSPGQPTLLAFSNSPGCTNCGNRALVSGWVNTGQTPGLSTFYWTVDRPVFVFYEAGETPQVKMYATANFAFVGNATLHGYLIDATN